MPMLDIQRRHAEVFRLRLGEKGRNGAPQKLTDAIRVTSHSRAVIDAFVAVYGGETKPWDGQWEAKLPTTELPIMVLPGQSISQWWELYRGSVCERRCDGEVESLSGNACVCPLDITERLADKNACRPMTRVNVLCPDVDVVGAGSLVTHGMVAAETLPQAVAVAEAALSRGLMVPGVLRIVEHKGKRHYIVPQIEIVGVSLAALTTGEVPQRPALAAGATAALEAPEQKAIAAPKPAKKAAAKKAAPAAPRELPPLPGEEALPVDEQKAHVAKARQEVLTSEQQLVQTTLDGIGAAGLRRAIGERWRVTFAGKKVVDLTDAECDTALELIGEELIRWNEPKEPAKSAVERVKEYIADDSERPFTEDDQPTLGGDAA
jgi:hypothetical protein